MFINRMTRNMAGFTHGSSNAILLTGAMFLLIEIPLQAQDTSRRKNIEITSTFKPVLRDASKILFTAAPALPDTGRPVFSYKVPSQQLSLAYQPLLLKPVTLLRDSLTGSPLSNFIKLGFGNLHQPFLKAAFTFGQTPHSKLHLYADHFTSKGKLSFQRNTMTRLGAHASVVTDRQIEWNTRVGMTSDDYYLYGYRPDTLSFTKEQLLQRFQTLEVKTDFRNTAATEFGLTYHPSLQLSLFGDRKTLRASEVNSVIDLPLEKSFGEKVAFRVGVTADITRYQFKDLSVKQTRPNDLYYVTPTLIIKTNNLYVHGGIRPSWDNGNFRMLPNVMADISTGDDRFTVQLGWIGYFQKGSYRRFAGMNPWLRRPDSLLNTSVEERYAGFKGSVSNHFFYSAKVGFQNFQNMPLFVNSPGDGKEFLIRYEPKLEALHLHTEVEYSQSEQLSAFASLNFYQFRKLKSEAKAWGMIPLELNAGLRWQLLQDLWLRTDLWTWSGPQFLSQTGNAFKGNGAFDLNAGAEFRITRSFNLWLQMNNILNNRYERWNQYQTFGFNIIGGITYSFDQAGK